MKEFATSEKWDSRYIIIIVLDTNFEVLEEPNCLVRIYIVLLYLIRD